jgi:hypothetical protein
MTDKQQQEIIQGFREIAFPADPESVDIRERMKALELLAKLAGLFDRPQEEAKPEPLAVRFVETDGAEG